MKSSASRPNSSGFGSILKDPSWMVTHRWAAHRTLLPTTAWKMCEPRATIRSAVRHHRPHRLLRRTITHPESVRQMHIASTTCLTGLTPTPVRDAPSARPFRTGIVQTVVWVSRATTGRMSAIVVLTTDMGPTTTTHATRQHSARRHQSRHRGEQEVAEAKAAKVAKEERVANLDIDGQILQRTMVARTP